MRVGSVGLPFNPVLNVRKPSAGGGGIRRLTADEENAGFLSAVALIQIRFLSYIVRVALRPDCVHPKFTNFSDVPR